MAFDAQKIERQSAFLANQCHVPIWFIDIISSTLGKKKIHYSILQCV